MMKKTVAIIGMLILAGCTTAPEKTPTKTTPTHPSKKVTQPSSGVKITPYDQKEIKRQSVPVVVPQQKVQQKFNDGSQLPAFKTLMQKTQVAYKQQQLAEAERYALQAQRIAPQATETYLYLAMIADQRKEYANAEALARRGLSYAQSNAMKKQLWLIILKASEARNHSVKAQEARRALQAL
ncbi:tetratricopeptide repeat protein [Acinetobacter vivianii]|uniref:tetratricopeptide repeat protein n=1 Tax=Acinetobacter vivianii TaxID=1776742 RepID=UPI002DBFBA4D|nr:tetratricopeptide repeat protein [Acinetobacter vivianii]MEB6479110.1 tetratricopeptide repeat protein [Acinetobacter vivianii]MEB6657059.1 tetratricopeptide repeat protein [Acinetobacter vivianii]